MAMEVDALVKGLRDGSLPRHEWTHRAHLLAGVWFVRQEGLESACRSMPVVIRRYNDATGVANSDSSGYHETLTQAYLREIARQLRDVPAGVSVADCVAQVVASPLADSDWPHRYWQRATLWSVRARREWVDPDLMPLPL
jgi:hypothetical protein